MREDMVGPRSLFMGLREGPPPGNLPVPVLLLM